MVSTSLARLSFAASCWFEHTCAHRCRDRTRRSVVAVFLALLDIATFCWPTHGGDYRQSAIVDTLVARGVRTSW
jgi:hypothetical protein